MNFVLSSLSEGLLWSIMAIGVYLTFRILDIADMTAEGAFPLGAAVVASQIQAGNTNQKDSFFIRKPKFHDTLENGICISNRKVRNPSHNFDIDRVETRQSDNPCQEGWNFHFCMENTRDQSCNHPC